MPGPHAGNRNRPAYSGQPRFRFPKQIIQLFAPRKPLEFKPPPHKHKLRPMTGLAEFVDKFSTGAAASSSKSTAKTNTGTARKGDKDDDDGDDDERVDKFETPAQRRQRVKREKEERVKQVIRNARELWDPTKSDTTTPVAPSRVESLSSFPTTTTTTTSRGKDKDKDKMDIVGDDDDFGNDDGNTANKGDMAKSTSDAETNNGRNHNDDDDEGDSNNNNNNERNGNADKKKQNNSHIPPSVEKTKEPYSTVFVWNLSLSTVELRLQDAFEQFGPVRTVAIPKDRDGVPRGYAFVEFEEERDANAAVRQGDGMRVDGRRIKVDVERGRTVKGWLPNRLDGPFNSCSPNRRRR